jgi:hypothetical protein
VTISVVGGGSVTISPGEPVGRRLTFLNLLHYLPSYEEAVFGMALSLGRSREEFEIVLAHRSRLQFRKFREYWEFLDDVFRRVAGDFGGGVVEAMVERARVAKADYIVGLFEARTRASDEIAAAMAEPVAQEIGGDDKAG